MMLMIYIGIEEVAKGSYHWVDLGF